jgi:hypothetical protein
MVHRTELVWYGLCTLPYVLVTSLLPVPCSV